MVRSGSAPRDFWHEAPARFGEGTDTDLFIGRNTFGILAGMGLVGMTIDYVVVDTIRVPRETFAAIVEAWRDGYVDSVAEWTRFTREEAKAYFDQMITNIHTRAATPCGWCPSSALACHSAGRPESGRPGRLTGEARTSP